MNAIPDSQTFINFRRGDENAFRQLFEYYYPALFLFAKKLTGSHEEAEDITLYTFQKLFNICNQFNTEINVKAFLYITVRNNGLNYLKAQKRHHQKQKQFAESMKDDILLEYEYEIKAELLDTIHQAIESLPEECRKIFKLLYYNDMKPAEIAELLRISVSTVYNQKSRAIQTLRFLLTDNSMAIAWIIHTIAWLQNELLSPTHTISS
jgi:RNA polymerase sigma-70 factor (family 1)